MSSLEIKRSMRALSRRLGTLLLAGRSVYLRRGIDRLGVWGSARDNYRFISVAEKYPRLGQLL